MSRSFITVTASLALAALMAAAACSTSESAPRRAADAASTVAGAPSSTGAAATPSACALIGAPEMSAIVGVALTAEAEESSSSTTCRYRPAQGGGLVQVEVNWGAGEAAMTGVSIVSRLEPGIAEALAGVGDQAAAVGPALMIRTGEDLITLTFFDVDPAPAVIRRIVGTMRPRMGPRAQPG